MRNEAHRFGLTFHRNKRSKQALDNELQHIPGIGEKTVLKLLRKFKSKKRVSEASFDELSKIVGSSRAKKLIVYFQDKAQTEENKS